MIISLITIGLGVLAFFLFLKYKKLSFAIKNVATTPIAILKEMLLNKELDVNSRFMTEIEGVVSDKYCLEAPFSKQKVVYCTAVEKEKYQEKYKYVVNNRTKTSWRTKYNILSDKYYSIRFEVNNSSGDSIIIDPTGSQLDLVLTFNQFFPDMKAVGHDLRRLGIEQKEKSLTVHTTVYAIGELKIENNEMILCKPANNSYPFIITNKTKSRINLETKIFKWLFLVLSILNFILGLTLLIINIVEGV